MTGGGTCRASPSLPLPLGAVPGHPGADSCGAGRSTFPGFREAKPNTRGVFTFPAVGIHHARPSDEGRSCAALAPKPVARVTSGAPSPFFLQGATPAPLPVVCAHASRHAAHCGSWRDASHNPPRSHPGCRRPEGSRALALRGTGRCAEGSRFSSAGVFPKFHSSGWTCKGAKQSLDCLLSALCHPLSAIRSLPSALCHLCRIPLPVPLTTATEDKHRRRTLKTVTHEQRPETGHTLKVQTTQVQV